MKIRFFLFFLLFSISSLSAQTVGTIINSQESHHGYNLFSPLQDTVAYLVDNCGNLINKWESQYNPGASFRLAEDGYLYRSGNTGSGIINAGGAGGIIEKFDWDGNIVWSYNLSNSNYRLHHDFTILPNGNILAIAWERILKADAIAIGRDSMLFSSNAIWSERIIEIEPIGTNSSNIVWEWYLKDHLIQDFDATKANFGNVSENPQLIDINYVRDASPDWMHYNAIDYNPQLDQILLCSPFFNELHIIDHSTSTADAAGHTGGDSGKGGDIIYRYGNPAAYQNGTIADQTLFFQHDAHWVKPQYEYENQIALFNNRNTTNGSDTVSSINILKPSLNSNGEYSLNSNQIYDTETTRSYFLSPELRSDFISGVQVLPYGNLLITSGVISKVIELDPNDNIVWEYHTPLDANGPMTQGAPHDNPLWLFRCIRYDEDFSGFNGLDLSPGNPIEVNPLACNLFENATNINEFIPFPNIKSYPNPTHDFFSIDLGLSYPNLHYQLVDINGKLIEEKQVNMTSKINIETKRLTAGIYFVKIITEQGIQTEKFIKA